MFQITAIEIIIFAIFIKAMISSQSRFCLTNEVHFDDCDYSSAYNMIFCVVSGYIFMRAVINRF